MEQASITPSPYPSYTKTYAVDYLRIRDDLWRARATVQDPIYKVIVTLDIAAPGFVIQDSAVRFLNYPRGECEAAAPKIKELIGADVRGPFRDILRREYLGPKGCDTVFNLVNMAGRAFIFVHAARQVGMGAMTDAEYAAFFAPGIGCVADQSASPLPKPFAPKDCVPAIGEPKARHWQAQAAPGDENEPVCGRRTTIDYIELSDSLWRGRAHLVDYEHNIVLTCDVSTSDLVVQDAEIVFLRQPYKACNSMQPRMKKIVGACLATDFRQRIGRDFIGLEGCGNAYVLLNSMHRGFLQFYLWRNSVLGRLSPDQEALCKQGLRQDCIACGL